MNVLPSARVVIFVFLFSAVFGFGCQAAATETIVLLQPAMTEENEAFGAPESGESYVKRSGRVIFAAKELFLERRTSEGSGAAARETFREAELVLSFFPDRDIRVTVDSESESASGVLSLGGRQDGSTYSTFTMTVTDDTYLITFQDVSSGLTYKVVGDMDSGIGRVTEFDLAKLPPAFDSEPVLPPEE
jgi:hypothetical protein